MTHIGDVAEYLESVASTQLAEEWDNVGLLVGAADQPLSRVMTCLTVTPESASEAIERGAELIVTHHPLPFRPFKRITTEETGTRLLWDLIRAGVAIYSPHTGFDSATGGINDLLAERIGLKEVTPLVPAADGVGGAGAGRMGIFDSLELGKWVESLKQEFGLSHIQYAGEADAPVSRVAIACGSGGSFLDAAVDAGCNAFLTGETNFHTFLEARARQVSLVLLGHYVSERFAVEVLAGRLAEKFSGVEIWASEKESDPVLLG